MKLQQVDLSLRQVDLDIEDATSEVAFLQDQLSVGEVDGATLDSALIALNSAKMRRIDLLNSKQELLYRFSIVSDKSYDEIVLPKLTMIDQEAYLKDNISVKQSLSKNSENRYWKNVIISQYLPALNVQFNYNAQESINQRFSDAFAPFDNKSSYTSYGFSLSMPLFDVNMLKSVESAKVDYLKSTISINQVKADEKRFYQTKLSKVRALDTKRALCERNFKLYGKVFQSIQNSFNSGDATQLELQKSRHQWQIKEMEIQKVYLDQQIELLALYEKLQES